MVVVGYKSAEISEVLSHRSLVVGRSSGSSDRTRLSSRETC